MDLISIGDVTEDVFVKVDKAASVHQTSDHKFHLDFKFGTKLAIDTVDKLIGGNAGNMAIGSSRLGLNSALYAEVGDDTQGKRLLQSLKDNNVSTKYFYLKKGEKTNYSVVLYYKGERTILVHHEKRAYKFPKLTPSKYVYLTSMSKGSERIFKPLLSYIKKNKSPLGFNPGTHQLNLGIKKLQPILKKTHFLCINTEEAQKLLKTNRRDFPYLLNELHKYGPKNIAITDGKNGSYSYNGEKFYFCPVYGTEVVERTGCGDAFSTGFMSALAYGKHIKEALRWATINSASVIQKVGPQAGLIKLSTLKKIIKINPKFQAREFTGKEVKSNRLYCSPVKKNRTF